MNDDIVKRAAHASKTDAPPFETILAARSPRRVRKLRAGLALIFILAVAAAPFALRQTPDDAQVAMLTPPTTDWLLETPDPQWVAQLDRNTPEEPSHVQ